MTERLARGIALTTALALPFALVAVIVHFAVEVPYWDEWEWANLVFRSHTGTLSFGDLWAQHNEHRIFLDNLAAVALDRLGGWSVVREQCFSAVMVVLTQLVVWRIVRRTVAADVAPLAFLCASLVLYDLSQYENFSWGFQMAWFMCNLGVVVVVWFLSDPPDQARPILVPVIAAALASVASSQGLVAWPVGIVALLLARRGTATVVAWTVCGLVVGLVARSGIQPLASGHVSILHNLPQLALYALTYLGTPLGRAGGIGWCAAAGALALAAAAVSFVADLRAPDRRERLARRAPWYALASYAIACALVTGPARLGFGLVEAIASRYSSIAGFLDIAVIGLAATYLDGLRVHRRALALAGTLAVAVAIGASSLNGYVLWRHYASDRRADVAALRSGDAAAAHDLYPDANALAMFEKQMHAIGDGVFYR